MSLTKSEKISLGTKEIARRIRQQLKREFPKCKFSVRIEYYSMGSSITVSLMIADKKVIKDFQDIPQEAILLHQTRGRTLETLKEIQGEDYAQLNPFQLRGDYDPREWCNGVFLTKQGHGLLQRVVKIADYYNFDDSDPMTDYYSVNFAFHLQLGKWNKPFKRWGMS